MIYAVLSPFFVSEIVASSFAQTIDEEGYARVRAKAKELLKLNLDDMSRGEQFLVESQLHFLHRALREYTDRVIGELEKDKL